MRHKKQGLLACMTMCIFWLGCGTSSKKATAAKSADATADKDHDPEFLKAINTTEVQECNAAGMVYERRQNGCSTELRLATTFTCDRAGVRAAFAATGYQIDQALNQAMGPEGDPAARGDGFVFDQCGESDSGRRFVQLVVKGADNQVHVREFEAVL